MPEFKEGDRAWLFSRDTDGKELLGIPVTVDNLHLPEWPGRAVVNSARDSMLVPLTCLYPEDPLAAGGDKDLADRMQDHYWFIREVCRLRAAFRHILAQEGDDLCWRDFYTVAAAMLPEKDAALAKLKSMPPKPVMMHNCDKFTSALCAGRPGEYVADSPEAIIEQLKARVAELERGGRE